MGWFSSWFSKPPPEDYEQILAALSLSISSRQTRLTELALRERRATLWATIYTLAIWAIYSFVWWLNLVPRIFQDRTRSNTEIERVAHLAPVIIGPLVALFLRRIVQAWYRRKGAAEEATLKKLLAQQRTTIEDIKKKTNYYSTRNLIERYDGKQTSQPQTPQTRRAPQDQTDSQLRRRPPGPQNGGGQSQNTAPNTPAQVQQTPGIRESNPANQFVATPPHPPRRQWFDKVADALLGADDGSQASLDPARSRYALICGRCSAHNGLVLESMWEDTQYVCPKCGHFNAAPRSLRQRQRLSPNLRDSNSISPEPDRQSRLPRPNFLSAPDGRTDESRSRSRSRSNGGDRDEQASEGEGEGKGGNITRDSNMELDE